MMIRPPGGPHLMTTHRGPQKFPRYIHSCIISYLISENHRQRKRKAPYVHMICPEPLSLKARGYPIPPKPYFFLEFLTVSIPHYTSLHTTHGDSKRSFRAEKINRIS